MKALQTEKKREAGQTPAREKSGYEKRAEYDFPEDYLGQGFEPPERFTLLITKLSHPANTVPRAQVLTKMQQTYGNAYVQRAISASGLQSFVIDELGSENLSLDENTGPSPAGGQPGAAAGAGSATGAGTVTGGGIAAGLQASQTALPRVSLGHFRSSGSLSSNNKCRIRFASLGVDSSSGINRMEIRGDISGHIASAQYDIKRTKERATWKKVSGSWSQLTHVGPGANDDTHDQDEDLTPDNNQIYSIDGPGFRSLSNPVGDASATEVVYKASFVESANVKVGTGAWKKSSNELEWHSISWLEKVGGNWRRKQGESEIKTGSITVGRGNP